MALAAHTHGGSGSVLATHRERKVRKDREAVRGWLHFVCVLILAMVVVGGATRLTESGLSITEWKPIHGVIPPLTEAEWEEELEKYRQIPEYQLINKGMSLEEFKFIFWWEWGHRLLGRVIGVAFFVPMVAFWWMGRLEPWLKPRLVFALFLGGLQGGIGWWMVTSGLVERVDVSQYRLSIHLTLACIIFAYLYWLARRLAPLPDPVPHDRSRLLGLSIFTLLVVFVQIFLGGLVAGLNAGMTFNTWPLMDGQIVPKGLLVMDPWWLNMFENVMTVQFQHRVTAYALIAVAIVVALSSLAVSGRREVRRAGINFAGFVLLQATLGILTLIWNVPLSIALLHQAFAVVVLAAALDHLAALTGGYRIRS